MIYCNTDESRLVFIIRNNGPISAQELASELGISNQKTRAIISHLRADHHLPICSTTREGYYWPAERLDALPTLNQLRSRINEMKLVIEGIEEGLDDEFGTMRLFDMGEAIAC